MLECPPPDRGRWLWEGGHAAAEGLYTCERNSAVIQTNSNVQGAHTPCRSTWHASVVTFTAYLARLGLPGIEAGLLRGKYVKKHALAIHRSCITDLKPSLRRGWSDQEAAAFLGLSPSFLKWLVARQKLRLSHLPIEGGLFSHEDVGDVRARFLAARRYVLPYSNYMTVPRFLNSSPSVQAASATSVLEALRRTDSLETTTTCPPPRSSKSGGENIYLILSDGYVTDPPSRVERIAGGFTPLGDRTPGEPYRWMDKSAR